MFMHGNHILPYTNAGGKTDDQQLASPQQVHNHVVNMNIDCDGRQNDDTHLISS